MSVGGFTASSIAVDQDSKEEESNKKRSTIDFSKLEANVKSNKEMAAKVGKGLQSLQLHQMTLALLADFATVDCIICKTAIHTH